jgi:hypothetical protein
MSFPKAQQGSCTIFPIIEDAMEKDCKYDTFLRFVDDYGLYHDVWPCEIGLHLKDGVCEVAPVRPSTTSPANSETIRVSG